MRRSPVRRPGRRPGLRRSPRDQPIPLIPRRKIHAAKVDPPLDGCPAPAGRVLQPHFVILPVVSPVASWHAGSGVGIWPAMARAEGGMRGRRALDGRGPPVKAQHGREKPGVGGCGSHRAGARGESRCAAAGRRGCPPWYRRPEIPQPGLHSRRRAPASLPLRSCPGRHHGGPPPRAGTPAASSASAGAAVLPQPPVPVFLASIRLHGGPRPSRARRPRESAKFTTQNWNQPCVPRPRVCPVRSSVNRPANC
jgi:hypothetical protein